MFARFVVLAVALVAVPAVAQTGTTYFGARAGVAVPPGSQGVAPTYGLEFGLAPTQGLGLGLHAIYSPNPPSIDFLGHATHAFGIEADMRWFLASNGPLQLYPFLSAGFMTGPEKVTGENLLLPLLNAGLGTKVDLGTAYIAMEFGLAALHIPSVNFTVGAMSRTHTSARRAPRVAADEWSR